MRYRFASLSLILVLCSSTPLLAQAVTGHYITSAATTDTTMLADGSSLVRQQYPMASFTDAGTGLFGNVQNRCSAWSHVPAGATEDTAAPLAGDCFGLDPDGDAYWFWWRADEGGTEACPTLCGSWSVYHGTGKYAGLKGRGTWRMTTPYADGSSRGTFTFRGM